MVYHGVGFVSRDRSFSLNMAAEIVSILRGILSNLHYESRDVKDAVEREGYCLDCLSSLDECREHCMTCGTRRCCTHDAPTGSAEEWEEAKPARISEMAA